MFGHFTSGDINRKCNIISYMKPNFYNKQYLKSKYDLFRRCVGLAPVPLKTI